MRYAIPLFLLMVVRCAAYGETIPFSILPHRHAIPQVRVDPRAQVTKEQIFKPGPMTAVDQRVMRNLEHAPTERLIQILRVYEKENNQAMMLVISAEILKRNPEQPDAIRANETATREEARPPEFSKFMASEVRSGRKASDPEAVSQEAHRLTEAHDYAGAVKLLEQLREVNFPTGPYPYLEDLASAYQDAGQLNKAQTAFQAVVNDPDAAPDSKQDAERELKSIILERRIEKETANAEARPEAGVIAAEKLMREYPNDPQVIAFQLDCWDTVGRYNDVITKLLELKAKNTSKIFAYQESLAFAYYGAKKYPLARAAFAELLADPGVDAASRKEATEAIDSMELEDQVALGDKALEKGDTSTAKRILDNLERRWPEDDQVLGLRAMWMHKTGRSADAVQFLLIYQRRAKQKHEAFGAQDTLADLYVERKEYELAARAYGEILTQPGFEDDQREEAKRGLVNARREQFIDQGDKALKNAHIKQAQEIGTELSQLSPKDADVQTYLAELKLALGNAAQASQELTQLKSSHYVNMVFPGQDSLGDALNRSGQWEEAYAAYTELLDKPGYEPDDVFDAGKDRLELLPFIRNDLKLESVFVDEEQGKAYRQSIAFATAWWDGWRVILKMREDTIDLSGHSIFTDRSGSSMEGQVALQRRFQGGYFAEVSVGGASENVLYGAHVGKLANQGIGWSFGFSGNARTTDYSLPLELFNARENRLEFTSSGEINERLRFEANSFFHVVSVDQQELGTGFGFNGDLESVLQAESRTKAEITVAYVGEYSRFNPSSTLPSAILAGVSRKQFAPLSRVSRQQEILDELISKEINRQGLQLAMHKHLGNNLSVYAEGEVYFDFFNTSWNYMVAGGLEYRVKNSTKLTAEVRFDSDGRGPNSGSGVIEATLGVRFGF